MFGITATIASKVVFAIRYAQIRRMDISNGEGIGVALFVQGCHFHCKNCFNPETWDFQGGKEWTTEVEDRLLDLADKPYIKRISILGGEPLADENVDTIWHLIQKIRCRFGGSKQIWLYTGYTFEELKDTQKYQKVFPLLDVMVDGRYDDDLKDIKYRWAGSTNQRVIDVFSSWLTGEPIERSLCD